MSTAPTAIIVALSAHATHGVCSRTENQSSAEAPAASSRKSGRRRWKVRTLARFHSPQASSALSLRRKRPASETLYATTVRRPM